MKKKISLLLAAMMIVTLFAACSNTPAASTAPSTAPSAAPKLTSITVGYSLVGMTANPWGVVNAAEGQLQANLFDCLVGFDKDGKVQPSLAEKTAFSTDYKTITVTLRKGVKFNDGTELKAADVKFSIEKAMTCVNKQKTYLVNVAGVDVVDDYTAKINMKMVDVSILDKLTGVYIVSKAAAEKFGDAFGTTPENTVGTGPYIMTALNPKIEASLKSNDSYFKGAPSIKNVKLKAIADTNAMTVALQTGDIQATFGISGNQYSTLKADPNLVIDQFPSVAETFLFLNPKSGLTADLRIRQAIAYAINRDDCFQILTEGRGQMPDSPVNWDFTGLPSKDKTWTYKQDVAKAKQLIKDAGAEGKPIKILVPALDAYVKMATVVQNQLAAIGLKATVDQQDTNTMLANAKAGNFEVGVMNSGGNTRDAGDILYLHFYSKNIGSGNYSQYNNPEMDALLTQIQTTTDAAARTKLIGQAITKVTTDLPEIPLANVDGLCVHTKKLTIEPYLAQFFKIYYFQAV